jgi:hypothetical protein
VEVQQICQTNSTGKRQTASLGIKITRKSNKNVPEEIPRGWREAKLNEFIKEYLSSNSTLSGRQLPKNKKIQTSTIGETRSGIHRINEDGTIQPVTIEEFGRLNPKNKAILIPGNTIVSVLLDSYGVLRIMANRWEGFVRLRALIESEEFEEEKSENLIAPLNLPELRRESLPVKVDDTQKQSSPQLDKNEKTLGEKPKAEVYETQTQLSPEDTSLQLFNPEPDEIEDVEPSYKDSYLERHPEVLKELLSPRVSDFTRSVVFRKRL